MHQTNGRLVSKEKEGEAKLWYETQVDEGRNSAVKR